MEAAATGSPAEDVSAAPYTTAPVCAHASANKGLALHARSIVRIRAITEGAHWDVGGVVCGRRVHAYPGKYRTRNGSRVLGLPPRHDGHVLVGRPPQETAIS